MRATQLPLDPVRCLILAAFLCPILLVSLSPHPIRTDLSHCRIQMAVHLLGVCPPRDASSPEWACGSALCCSPRKPIPEKLYDGTKGATWSAEMVSGILNLGHFQAVKRQPQCWSGQWVQLAARGWGSVLWHAQLPTRLVALCT